MHFSLVILLCSCRNKRKKRKRKLRSSRKWATPLKNAPKKFFWFTLIIDDIRKKEKKKSGNEGIFVRLQYLLRSI